VALNVGPDFKQRWLGVPESVRQAYLDDLNRICDVLKPDTSLDAWVDYDQQQQQYSLAKIDFAYTELKAHLIEEAKIRNQLALEQKIAKKRAEQEALALQLQLDEERKFAAETEKLSLLRQSLEQEVHAYTARYTQNSHHAVNHISVVPMNQNDLSMLENLKLRLELESDALIEQAVTIFRAKLHTAAQEEIEYLLKNSEHIEK